MKFKYFFIIQNTYNVNSIEINFWIMLRYGCVKMIH